MKISFYICPDFPHRIFDELRYSTVAFLFSDDSDIKMFLVMMNA
jgi:hypothetical protein